ncbi:hypothetical protein EDC96DRAFT_506236 [Choanephora cucurbitarum]|nr:hypothetical protein EDC96DRAFT_506236 [Choanephora cucurbitarum]
MIKENKFMVGEEEESHQKKPTRSTTPTKRPIRHVKRRSSGKVVHVTKLTPMAKMHSEPEQTIKRSHHKTPVIPPSLTYKAMADPIQQPLNALAHNLSVPKLDHSFSKLPAIKPQKHLLRSQFVSNDAIVEDEQSQKLNKELEAISRQLRCIQRYQDPMRASLARLIEPHFVSHEHPSIAHRYHRLKEVAQQQLTPVPQKEGFSWSAAALLDKLFHPTLS